MFPSDLGNYEILPQRLILTLITSFVYILTGQYRSLSRYIGSKNIYLIALRNLLIIFIIFNLNIIFLKIIFPIKYFILLWLISTIFIGSIKFIFRDILISGSITKNSIKKKVIIYGAGMLGAQLASILKVEGYFIEAFVDDDKSKWNRFLYGIKIISLNSIKSYLKK